MWHDVRFAARIFVKSPGVTALVLATLALGIGANTTIFSVVNAVLLRPLPYKNPDRIVQVSDVLPETGGSITSSLPKYTVLREGARSLDALAAVSFGRFQIAGPSPAAPAEVKGERVSANFFRVFGVNPSHGRTFLEGEDQPGRNPVAVISDALWRTRFASDPAAIGSTISIDGEATAIVGVMPAGFNFPSSTQVWTPKFFAHPAITPVQIQRGASYLLYFGRLSDGTDIPSAEAELLLLSRQYDDSHKGFGDTGRRISVTRLRESLVSDVRRMLLILLGAAAFVLLIAAANVANVLLARAIARRKEVAIRASLGATRSRLLTQFLIESIVLSGGGAILAVVLSLWSVRVVAHIASDLLPRAEQIQINGTVLVFTIAVAVCTGILFGIGPALHACRVDLNDSLKTSGRGLAGGGRLSGIMIVTEVALATALLAGAGLLLRTFLRLESVDPGFRPENLMTMEIGLATARYPERSQQASFYDRLLAGAANVPGVQEAALANALPVNGRAIGYFFNIEGRAVLDASKAPTFWLHSISPNYFQTMRIPLLRGRPFTPADTAETRAVGIINEGMVRRFWPKEDPMGRHITYARESITVEIVGIAADVKIGGLGDETAYNQLYVPYRQHPFLTMWLITRGSAGVGADLRRTILGIDSDQPATAIRSMDDVISNSLSTPRLRTALIGVFAVLALILAIVGIAGVVAWSVSRRTNEIGIRMALGARPGNIIMMIARESLILIAAGELIGIMGAFTLTRLISGFLFGVTQWDPLSFAGATGLLGLAALTSSVLVARRALQVDPVAALRLE